MPSINEPLLSDSDVATLLGVSRTTVRRLRYSGALPTDPHDAILDAVMADPPAFRFYGVGHYRRMLRRIPKRTWGDWHIACDGSNSHAHDDTEQLLPILRAAGGIISLREFAYQFTVTFAANPALALDFLAGVLAHGDTSVEILAPYGVCKCG